MATMAKGRPSRRETILPVAWVNAFRRAVRIAQGLALVALALILAAAVLTFDPADPSLNSATDALPTNALGTFGAVLSDLLLQLIGVPAILTIPVIASIGVRVIRRQSLAARRRYILATLCSAFVLSLALGGLPYRPDFLPSGFGGALGFIGAVAANALAQLVPTIPPSIFASTLHVFLGIAGTALFFWGLGVDFEDWEKLYQKLLARAEARRERAASQTGDEDYEPDVALDASRRLPRPEQAVGPRPRIAVQSRESEDAPDMRTPTIVEAAPPPAPAAKPARRDPAPHNQYRLPNLALLQPAPKATGQKIDATALERNARHLEGVLEDFGVKGEISQVRPGPVVTMYELEPAPGIKASRVIGLADDIARSMSATSARVAVVPGRNVIGIELPNDKREMVSLSELMASQAFVETSNALPLVLGKNIAGEPIVADLAPMPHLLIAGTTGSGKSVGLNAMILSLLYRLTPEECRFIMIDPKMLELSVYDGIPHLLSPVVTEPPKAIRALRWAVEQMEDRYRMMASINVRNLAGFNQRIRDAEASNQPFTRRIHTGYDAETGQPVYETETLEFEALPLIVVVIDELADLMMTAGKEVEILIQRLAQKARAAGIHLIMATQRPSVDVITGVIKANLPTRISFSVSSKIDSRTILGEQGAEQLLGKGDMLYMPGGKQITRVHGPFVSDEEVEGVANFWREQGAPVYVDSVTEENAAAAGDFAAGIDGDDEEADLYRRAVQVVAESQKASTSYIQRQLRIGYNNAARLVERMEKDGYVGQADHVGRREVLIDADGQRI